MNIIGASVFLSVVSCVLSAIFFVFPFTLQGKEVSEGLYTYHETVGELIIPFYWKVEKKEQQSVVSVYEQGKSFINLCSADGATWRWQLKDSENDLSITAARKGNELKISGVQKGQPYEETVEIDQRPWYQPLSYSLKKFLRSERKATSFWTIRADTVEVTSLRAEKMGGEEILINGKTTLAEKVELRAEGFYSHFWHGTYWFRKSDKLFLMYRSVHGPPGTAETVVQLMDMPELQEE